MYRQGDVLIIPAASDAMSQAGQKQATESGRVVLAYGEATGHHHSIRSKHAALFSTATMGLALLELKRRATLRHQEHAPIVLPPGLYFVRRQREYVSRDNSRNVVD